MNATSDLTAKIIKSPGGTARKVVPLLGELDHSPAMGGEGIPDLWGVAEVMTDLAKITKAVKDHGLDTGALGKMGKRKAAMVEQLAQQFYPFLESMGEETRDNILDAWHLAHDLKKRSQAMAKALQPILEQLDERKNPESDVISIPVALLNKVRAIHVGEDI